MHTTLYAFTINWYMQVATLIKMTIHQVGQLEYDRTVTPLGPRTARVIVAPTNATTRLIKAFTHTKGTSGRALIASAALEDSAHGGGVAALTEACSDVIAPMVDPVRRRWLHAEHLDVLCDELLAMHAIMEPNPKNASRVRTLPTLMHAFWPPASGPVARHKISWLLL